MQTKDYTEEIINLYNLLPELDKIIFLENLKLAVKIKVYDSDPKNKLKNFKVVK